MDCIFCKIINGEIPSPKVFEDDEMIILRDINPQANLHFLLIPKKHFANIVEMKGVDGRLIGSCIKKLGEMAGSLGLDKGFRIVSNKGEFGGQTVEHFHIHILGGEKLSEIMA